MKLISSWTVVCLVMIVVAPSPAHAIIRASDTTRFMSGFQRILLAPFQLPMHMLRGTVSGAPILGTVGGIFTGTVSTITSIVGGTFEMGTAAAPYAKYAVFAL